jgi:hypothetical protein
MGKHKIELRAIPRGGKTPEICLAAVQEDGLALQEVPKAFRTAEVCDAAVKQNATALQYVPEGITTPEIERLAEAEKKAIRAHEEMLADWDEGTKKYRDALNSDKVVKLDVSPRGWYAPVSFLRERLGAKMALRRKYLDLGIINEAGEYIEEDNSHVTKT